MPVYSVRNRPRRCRIGTTLGEVREPTRIVGRHHVETVGRALGEPFFDGVGDLLRGAGEYAVAARPGQSVQEPGTVGRSLATISATTCLRLRLVVGDVAGLAEGVEGTGASRSRADRSTSARPRIWLRPGGYGEFVEPFSSSFAAVSGCRR